MFFAIVLLSATFALTISERHSSLETSAIMFEAASALGTVGLSCGITPSLTTAGKIIIILTMLTACSQSAIRNEDSKTAIADTLRFKTALLRVEGMT